MGLCDTAKANALTNFGNKSYTATVSPVAVYETTQSTDVACGVVKGQVLGDLSAYHNGSGSIYLKASKQSDGESNNPPISPDGTWRQWKSASLGSLITEHINDTVTPSFSMDCTDPVRIKGWYLTDATVIMRPTRSIYAQVPYGNIGTPQLITPDEYLGSSLTQFIAAAETDVSWNLAKLSSSGGLSRSYGSGDIEFSITPTALAQFNGSAPGFDHGRFTDTYKPTILVLFTGAMSVASTRKLYINGTLMQTTSLASGSVAGAWAFSVKGIGAFGDTKPPQNNPSDNYDGWSAPQVRITLTGATAGVLSGGTRLTNYVVNYPF